jgi:hypothetical protein
MAPRAHCSVRRCRMRSILCFVVLGRLLCGWATSRLLHEKQQSQRRDALVHLRPREERELNSRTGEGVGRDGRRSRREVFISGKRGERRSVARHETAAIPGGG